MLSVTTEQGTHVASSAQDVGDLLSIQHGQRSQLLTLAVDYRRAGCTSAMCPQCGLHTAFEMADHIVCTRCGHIDAN